MKLNVLVLSLFLALTTALSSCAHVKEMALDCKDPVTLATATQIEPFVLAIMLCENTDGETKDCIARELARLSYVATTEAVNCALAKAHDKIIRTKLERTGHE